MECKDFESYENYKAAMEKREEEAEKTKMMPLRDRIRQNRPDNFDNFRGDIGSFEFPISMMSGITYSHLSTANDGTVWAYPENMTEAAYAITFEEHEGDSIVRVQKHKPLDAPDEVLAKALRTWWYV